MRLLRLQSNGDPVALATQACISLRQFYQLENGETSLFYNTGLRNQAGRRVATLLGVCWDELDQTALSSVQETYIKLVSTPTADAGLAALNKATVAQAIPTTAPAPALAIPVGRDKPANDTLVLPASAMAQNSHHPDAEPPQPQTGTHPLWTLTGWLLAALAGAATGSALAVYGGVRLSMLLKLL